VSGGHLATLSGAAAGMASLSAARFVSEIEKRLALELHKRAQRRNAARLARQVRMHDFGGVVVRDASRKSTLKSPRWSRPLRSQKKCERNLFSDRDRVLTTAVN
jgi:hypothetical protein